MNTLKYSLVAMILISLSLSSCSGYLEYQPPFLPISFAIDQTGNVTVSAEAKLPTPLGDFTIGAEMPLVDNNHILVIIRDRNKGTEERYLVDSDRNVRVITNGKTQIDVNNDGEVIIDITDGNIHSVTVRAPCTNILAVGCRATAYAMDEGLKLRAGAGLQYPILENLPRGSIVTIIGTPQSGSGYTWWHIRSKAGNEGWAVESADGLATLVAIPDSDA